jgi:undecaprenyl-diphosphatase
VAGAPFGLGRAKDLVQAFDVAVERRIDEVRGHKALDRTMYVASELGDWSLIWHVVGVGQALLPGRAAMSAVRLSTILGAESLLVNVGIKSLFRRTRPVWGGATERPHKLRTPRSSSFPSGHASAAFTAAGVLAQGDPLAPAYYAMALVVASSRAYAKIHHPSDVVAGAVLGVALAAIARQVWPWE